MVEIERRYEYYSRSGKTWTKWFYYNKAENEEEAKIMIKKWKKEGELNKKLKGEYRITKGEQE